MRHEKFFLYAVAGGLACLAAAAARAQTIGDPSGAGPYPAIAESRAELPGHTVYRPVSWPRTPLPSQLGRLHAPVFYLTGGPSDVAHPNATDDVERIDRVPVFFGSLPVGHGGLDTGIVPLDVEPPGRPVCARGTRAGEVIAYVERIGKTAGLPARPWRQRSESLWLLS